LLGHISLQQKITAIIVLANRTQRLVKEERLRVLGISVTARRAQDFISGGKYKFN